ncbi:MAG TPA: HYR domain-containing protein [Candidatus Limnocylindrales bacterium]|nr:HYR domain-containing protein [Candidatus Limnocylindrales bacterium]
MRQSFAIRLTAPRAVVRATALAVGIGLAAAPAVLADSFTVDGDSFTTAVETSVDLGTVAAGGVVDRGVGWVLTCSGTDHLNAGSSISISVMSAAAPGGGAMTAAGGTFGPLSSWPADGGDCGSNGAVATLTRGSVHIVAPTINGTYNYSVTFKVTLPAGETGVTVLERSVAYSLRVGTNDAPTLALPSDMTVEGNEAGGAAVDWTATASDTEDDPDPAPTCTPTSGSHFDLGTTTVQCSVTDSGGLTANGSFDVTVVDTAAPSLDQPADVSAVSTDGGPVTLTYATPAASDVVDPSPSVDCAPASGSSFPVGTTSVTCTATDASGNSASVSFAVTVAGASAVFDAPIGPSNVVASNASRSIPVKARAWIGDVEQTAGTAHLSVRSCDGGDAVGTVDLAWDGARWTGKLDTSAFGVGCWRAGLVVNGVRVGGFDFGSVTSGSTSNPTANPKASPKGAKGGANH